MTDHAARIRDLITAECYSGCNVELDAEIRETATALIETVRKWLRLYEISEDAVFGSIETYEDFQGTLAAMSVRAERVLSS